MLFRITYRNWKLVKKDEFPKIIKRYTGTGGEGKKIVEKIVAEGISKNSSSVKPPIITQKPPITSSTQKQQDSNYGQGLPKTSPNQQPQKEEKANANNFKFPKKILETKKPVIKNENQGKNSDIPGNFIKNENEKIQEGGKNKVPFKEKVIENLFEKKNQIPNPPPLPKEPLVKPMEKIKIENISPEVLISAKNNLINKYNVPASSKINSDTKSADLSKDQFILELVSRGLAKIDENQLTPASFKDHEGNKITLSEQYANIKFTKLGGAYLESIENSSSKKLVEKYNKEDYEIFLAVPIEKPTSETCLLSNKQTHLIMVIAKKKQEEETVVIGYLTSQKTETMLSPIQFNKFQENLENKKSFDTVLSKNQYFRSFDYAEKIKKENFVNLKYVNEYLNYKIGINNIKDIIVGEHKKLLEKGEWKNFNPTGITRSDLLKICHIFDYNVKNNKSHPQTDSQKIHHELSKEKQKKNQLEKKLTKKNEKFDDNNED